MNAIILCGGLSTRLGDITKDIPKVLLEIKGKTVLDWQIEKLKKLGLTEVVLAAGHLAPVLWQEIGDSSNGMKLIHVVEEKKLGTGGAIKYALNFVKNPAEPTIVLNGDVLTSLDLSEMISILKDGSDGLILGAKVDNAACYGTLEYDDDFLLKRFKEKEGLQEPGYINGGFYIFNPAVKKYFPQEDAFSIEYEVFPKMTDLYVYESDEPWIDIGVPERLEWAREYWNIKY